MPRGVYARTTKTRAILSASRVGNKNALGFTHSAETKAGLSIALKGNQRALIHGMRGTYTYTSWKSMKQRCNYAKHKSYVRYGGAGITVCARWDSFDAFYADMGERPADTSLDRHPNPAGNYEPGNCRWATAHEQRINRISP